MGVIVAACGEDLPLPVDTETGSTSKQNDDGDPTTMTTVDPSTTGSDETTVAANETSTGDDTTGPGAVCGNGIVEEGETCDDDNALNGDACYSNCTTAFEIAWTISHNSGPQIHDNANALLLDTAGAIITAGSISSATTDADISIQQFSPDGRAGWSYTYDGNLGADEFAYAATWLGTDIVIAGVSQIDTVRDALVLRIDPSDGSTIWAAYFDGPAEIDDGEFLYGVAVTPDGMPIVVGAQTVADGQTDAWIAALSPDDGSIVWEDYFAGELGNDDWAEAVAVDGAGTIHVVGNQIGSTGWHRSYDSNGVQTGEHALEFIPQDIAVDDAGNVVLAGWEAPGGTGADLALYYYDATFTEQWVAYADGPSHGFDILRDVTIGADGEIYATGAVTHVGQQDDLWAGRFSASGELLWSDQYNNPRLNIYETGNAIALDPAGDVVVIGRENQFGEGVNIFARKYVQYAPPG